MIGWYELLYIICCCDIMFELLLLYDLDMLMFMLILPYVDSIHIALSLTKMFFSFLYVLVLMNTWSLACMYSYLCIKDFKSDLSWLWTKCPFNHDFKCFICIYSYLIQVVALTHNSLFLQICRFRQLSSSKTDWGWLRLFSPSVGRCSWLGILPFLHSSLEVVLS